MLPAGSGALAGSQIGRHHDLRSAVLLPNLWRMGTIETSSRCFVFDEHWRFVFLSRG